MRGGLQDLVTFIFTRKLTEGVKETTHCSLRVGNVVSISRGWAAAENTRNRTVFN